MFDAVANYTWNSESLADSCCPRIPEQDCHCHLRLSRDCSHLLDSHTHELEKRWRVESVCHHLGSRRKGKMRSEDHGAADRNVDSYTVAISISFPRAIMGERCNQDSPGCHVEMQFEKVEVPGTRADLANKEAWKQSRGVKGKMNQLNSCVKFDEMMDIQATKQPVLALYVEFCLSMSFFES